MTQRQRQRTRRRRGTRRHPLLLGLMILIGGMTLTAVSAVAYVGIVALTAPNLDELKPLDMGTSSVIYAPAGPRLGYVQSETIRQPIAWGSMPVSLRRATVAI